MSLSLKSRLANSKKTNKNLTKTAEIAKVPAVPWIMRYVTFFDEIDLFFEELNFACKNES